MIKKRHRSEGIVANGASNIRNSPQYWEDRQRITERIYQRYSKELAQTGYFKSLFLEFRILREISKEIKKIKPSKHGLYLKM